MAVIMYDPKTATIASKTGFTTFVVMIGISTVCHSDLQ